MSPYSLVHRQTFRISQRLVKSATVFSAIYRDE